ncbi:MAG: hypothetical protein KDD44_05165, partial [Bdellovibrionales bacterium]|nr:hypothetical protein [Bdellovibrionales bacterium]
MGRVYAMATLVVMGAIAHPCTSLASDSDAQLPLLHLSDFTYEGAFRLPADDFGASSLNYSEGPIAYNADNHSIFIVGHTYQQAIAEFAVPALVASSTLSELPMAAAPIQEFVETLGSVPGGNPQGLNRIGGLKYIVGLNGPELLVNAYEYYDAPGDNTHSTYAIRDA